MIESSLIRALKEEISMFIHVLICWWPFVLAGPGGGNLLWKISRSTRASGLCNAPSHAARGSAGFHWGSGRWRLREGFDVQQ